MYLTDYHTHSSMSFDGHAPMADIAAAAERAGLDELCITDHCDFLDEHGRPNRAYDWDGACAQYREALAACKPGFTLRLGLEFGMSHLDPAAAAAICARPEADFILGSIHNLCPEKGGTDLYVVPYPDEAACCAALDDYFASMALLADTDFYDVLAHIIYPLRYMEVPVSLEPYYGGEGPGHGDQHLPGAHHRGVEAHSGALQVLRRGDRHRGLRRPHPRRRGQGHTGRLRAAGRLRLPVCLHL